MSLLAFDALDTQLAGPAASSARRRAWARFRELGLPTRRLEHWRYTDLAHLTERTREFLPPADTAGVQNLEQLRALLESAALGTGSRKLVLVDGRPVPELSDPLALQGLAFDSSPAGTGGPPPELVWPQAEDPESGRHPLKFLNTALMSHVTTLRFAAGARHEAPLHCLFVTATGGHAWQPRLRIELGESARALVIQHFIDLDGLDGWTNAVCEIRQARGSVLDFHRVQEHGSGYLHTGLYRIELAAAARLRFANLDYGGQLARTDIDLSLTGPEATAEILGLLLARQGQHVDTHVQVEHAAPATYSRQVFRAVVGEHGRGIMNGKVIVRPHAQGIDATQASDGLLLSAHGEIDAKPELEIYADSVKCSHGATIGEIDADQLFYLRARGVPEEEARNLLTFAFVNHLLQQMGHDGLRRYVTRRIAGGLFTGMDTEAARP